MNTEQASKVLAEACGVLVTPHWWQSSERNGRHNYKWTIDDARCREVVRKWWLNNNDNASVCFFEDSVEYEWVNQYKESQAIYRDNEIQCMIQIANNLEEKANENMR